MKAPRPTPPAPPRIPPVLAALVLALLVGVAYSPALLGGFVWDDDAYVSRNPTLHGLDGLWRIWFDPGATPQYYPLTFTSFWIGMQIWGLNPAGFHLVNLLLHALTAILLWRMLVRLGVPGAWLAAALFAVHPINVESVAWITERKNVLSAALALGSALCFFRNLDAGASRRWYTAALLLFAAALLSKTAICFLPAALLLVVWWKRGTVSRRELALLAPLFGIGFAFAMSTAWLERYHVGARGEEWSLAPVERVLVAGRALWFYLGKLLCPAPLVFNYPRWNIDATSAVAYLFPATALACLAALFLARARIGRAPFAAAAVFAGGLFPVLGFFDFYAMRYSFVADHFVYMPAVGLFALAAAGFARLTRGAAAWPMRLLAALVLCALVVLARRQTLVYRDLTTLWNDTLDKNPGSWLAHNNLGSVAFEQRSYAEAERHWRESLRLDPRHGETHGNLGRAAMQRGDFSAAEQLFREAVALSPESAAERMNLGVALSRQGRTAEAIAEYEKALELDPGDAALHSDLGASFAAVGRYDDAIREYQLALALDRNDASAHNNFGLVLAAKGDLGEAVNHYAEAIRLAPEMAEAHNNYAITLEHLGQRKEALAQYREVVRLSPSTAEAHYNLAAALAKVGEVDEAEEQMREALRLKPDLFSARNKTSRE